MVEGPDAEPKGKPYVDKIWAENYEKTIQDAMGFMDRIVVAVSPADEEEKLRKVLKAYRPNDPWVTEMAMGAGDARLPTEW